MTKLQISLNEASQFIARIEAAKEEGRLLNVIMPNGKPLGDCTKEYLQQIAEALTELGHLIEIETGTRH